MIISIKTCFNPYILFNFLFFAGCLQIKAQDTLIMNDGSEMYVKVIEIGDSHVSYKKKENLSGPTYVTDLTKIFMAVYEDGKRETFENNAQVYSTPAGIKESKQKEAGKSMTVVKNSNFEVRLIEVQTFPDKKKNSINISASADVFSNGKYFSKLSLSAYQRTDINLDYTNPNGSYLGRSSITFSLQSETLRNVLYEKFENSTGKGFGWALPPNFFSINPSSCSVALLRQKTGNKEVLGFGGISATKYNLADCSSVEEKLLSAALIWLETNFLKP